MLELLLHKRGEAVRVGQRTVIGISSCSSAQRGHRESHLELLVRDAFGIVRNRKFGYQTEKWLTLHHRSMASQLPSVF